DERGGRDGEEERVGERLRHRRDAVAPRFLDRPQNNGPALTKTPAHREEVPPGRVEANSRSVQLELVDVREPKHAACDGLLRGDDGEPSSALTESTRDLDEKRDPTAVDVRHATQIDDGNCASFDRPLELTEHQVRSGQIDL